MLSSCGDNRGRRVWSRLAVPRPHCTFKSSVYGLGATGGQNDFDGLAAQNPSNALFGVLKDGALALSCLVNGGWVSHSRECLNIDFPNRVGHGARRLVVEIDAHCGLKHQGRKLSPRLLNLGGSLTNEREVGQQALTNPLPVILTGRGKNS